MHNTHDKNRLSMNNSYLLIIIIKIDELENDIDILCFNFTLNVHIFI